MWIKLQWNTNKNLREVVRSVEACIATASITSATTGALASAGWANELKTGLDWDNSEIVRTNDPDEVITWCSHTFNNTNVAYQDRSSFNLLFPVYDNATEYYGISLLNTQDNETEWRVGKSSTINGGTTQSRLSPAAARNTRNTYNYVGNSGTQNTDWTMYPTTVGNAYNDISWPTIRTVFCYITNECLIWATYHQSSTPTGYDTTFGNYQWYTGPYIFSQYTRYDHWNSSTNGIIPLCYSNLRETGNGFRNTDFNARHNLGDVTSAGQTLATFRVFNLYSTYPRVGSTYDLRMFERVNWGSGMRYNDSLALNAEQPGRAGVTYPYDANIEKLIESTDYYRYPSPDLKTIGFAMYPIQMRASYWGFGGGNLSSQGGFYVFNGDYQPGDEFTYDNKTYTIMPTYNGYDQRVGIAVPKE